MKEELSVHNILEVQEVNWTYEDKHTKICVLLEIATTPVVYLFMRRK